MRLITRSDFDGLACGALLLEAKVVDSWMFAPVSYTHLDVYKRQDRGRAGYGKNNARNDAR